MMDVTCIKNQHVAKALENATILNRLLRIAIQNDDLETILEGALDELLSVSWLSLLPKGGIFLVDETQRNLRLTASRNLSPALHTLCARVPFGHCLCGRAALRARTQHASCVDHRHETVFEGMEPHGHYNLPIIAAGKVIGVLVVYLPDGHDRDDQEIEFLESVCDALALLIKLKQREAALQASRDALQEHLNNINLEKTYLEQHAEELVVTAEEQAALREKAEALEAKARHLALHDPLTDLPNRRYFQELCIKNFEKDPGPHAILFIDIDGFKGVNDSHGHDAGDELLCRIAQRLSRSLCHSDFAARFGGDEFAVFLHAIPSAETAERVATRIVEALKRPFGLERDIRCQIGASIGVALWPDHGQDFDSVIKAADKAMYHVKERGKNGVQLAGVPVLAAAGE